MIARIQRAFRRLRASNGGNVAVITALSAIPIIGMMGFAVDYATALSTKSKLDAAADAAAIAAITKAQSVISVNGQSPSATTLAIQQGTQQGYAAFRANAGALSFGMAAPVPAITVGRTGQTLSATVAYQTTSPNHFGSLFNVNTSQISGTSASSLTIGKYLDFYLMLDVSGSMGLPSTTAGQQALANINPDMRSSYPTGCNFACHFPGYAGYGLARSNNIQLRADAVGNAVCVLLQTALQTETLQNQYRVGIYPFVSTLGTFLPLSSNLSNAVTVMGGGASGCDPNQPSSVIGGLLDNGNTLPYGSGGTHFENAFPVMNADVGIVGDGSTALLPQPFVFLVTDGADNSQYYNNGFIGGSSPQLMDPSVCAAIKARGVTVAVLYVPYQPIQNPNASFAGNEDGKVNAIIPSIPIPLQKCATSSDWMQTANTPADIQTAILKMFTQALQAARLTQ